MELLGTALDGLCKIEQGSVRERTGRERHNINDDNSNYKSKNLHAERRRRQKLKDRLHALRALVPTITNLKKESIIEDAITYIQELQRNVKVLSDQLLEMESSPEEGEKCNSDEANAGEEMKRNGIEEDVSVASIEGNKLWIKIIFEKKRGGFNKLMEAMTYLGFELTDTSVTATKGALLVSSFVEGSYGEKLTVQQTKDLLLEIIKSI
ncbi:HLH domain-containing protein, partial [Cephalotus follicularis]